jgi:hypothetical protein
MDYWVLYIVSLCIMVTYAALGLFMFLTRIKIMDAFMKSNIFIYIFAFAAKPLFWYFCWQLELYNLSI